VNTSEDKSDIGFISMQNSMLVLFKRPNVGSFLRLVLFVLEESRVGFFYGQKSPQIRRGATREAPKAKKSLFWRKWTPRRL